MNWMGLLECMNNSLFGNVVLFLLRMCVLSVFASLDQFGRYQRVDRETPDVRLIHSWLAFGGCSVWCRIRTVVVYGVRVIVFQANFARIDLKGLFIITTTASVSHLNLKIFNSCKFMVKSCQMTVSIAYIRFECGSCNQCKENRSQLQRKFNIL